MKAFLAIAFLILLSPFALADDGLEEFGKRSMTFYKSPSREAFEEYQKEAAKLEKTVLSATSGNDVMMASTFAKISKKNGWPIIVKGTIGREAEDILSGKSPHTKYLEDDSRVDALKLDIWWGGFFGTGDTVYLEKILKYAGEPLPKGDVSKAIVIGAATWSFESNCRQNEDVRKFAEQKFASTTDPEKKTYLKKCIETRKK